MNDLLGYAAELGLDVHTFREDLRRRIHGGRIGRDVASADRSGVSGTPTFFFNGQRHNGTHDPGTLTRALDAAREGAEHACLRPEPKEQLCLLRLAVRRYRTRAQRGPIQPGRTGRRPRTVRAAGRRPSVSGRSARRVHGTEPTPPAVHRRTGGRRPPEWAWVGACGG
ncbi:DsbA family protein [Streptomyces olivaceoviridis]